MSRSVEEIAFAVAEVVGDALDDLEFADLVDRIAAVDREAPLSDQDLAPVTIEDGEGGVFELYRDGSYCLKVDGRLS